MGQTPMTLALNRNVWKTYLNVVNMWPIEKPGDERDPRTEAWIQCSHQDGWLKWQDRTRRMIMLLKAYGGTESSPDDVLAAIEEPFEMGSFFKSLGIAGDTLSGMVKDLQSANEAEGVVVEGGLGFLER
ncbi:hypothetical protein MMC29_005791, partial [Sticta canariensis]|nr:hypothetical protein [Sticta canariensis]